MPKRAPRFVIATNAIEGKAPATSERNSVRNLSRNSGEAHRGSQRQRRAGRVVEGVAQRKESDISELLALLDLPAPKPLCDEYIIPGEFPA